VSECIKEVSHPDEVAANAAAAQRLYSEKARFETERYANAEAPAGAAGAPGDTAPEAAVDAEVAELGRAAAAAFRELDIAGAPELTPDQAENRRRLGAPAGAGDKPSGAAQYHAPANVRRAVLEPGAGGAGARGPAEAEAEEGDASDPGAGRGYSS